MAVVTVLSTVLEVIVDAPLDAQPAEEGEIRLLEPDLEIPHRVVLHQPLLDREAVAREQFVQDVDHRLCP